jgi:hypothetical protein
VPSLPSSWIYQVCTYSLYTEYPPPPPLGSIRFADRLGLGIFPFDFDQGDMANVRRKICHCLCTSHKVEI